MKTLISLYLFSILAISASPIIERPEPQEEQRYIVGLHGSHTHARRDNVIQVADQFGRQGVHVGDLSQPVAHAAIDNELQAILANVQHLHGDGFLTKVTQLHGQIPNFAKLCIQIRQEVCGQLLLRLKQYAREPVHDSSIFEDVSDHYAKPDVQCAADHHGEYDRNNDRVQPVDVLDGESVHVGLLAQAPVRHNAEKHHLFSGATFKGGRA